jgi:coproporphyrinogen III oxidase-like Fe-S oxidoreductase
MYRPFVRRAAHSVYFGGGTSNLYRADQCELLQLVRNPFGPKHNQSTLEGIPSSSRGKLDAMRRRAAPCQHRRAAWLTR